MHKVYLKPGKEESLKRFHPWIFSGAIARFDGEPEEGEVVEVYTSKKEFWYNIQKMIIPSIYYRVVRHWRLEKYLVSLSGRVR